MNWISWMGALGMGACLVAGCGDDSGTTPDGDSTGSVTGTGGSMTGSPSTGPVTTVAPDSDSTSGAVDSTDTTASTSSTGTDGTDSGSGSDSGSESDSASTGEMGNGECTTHEDCASGYCREFSDVPPDEESLCQAAPAGGATRFTGTVRDIATLAAVADAQVRVVSAIQAVTDPEGATAIVSDTTNASGRLDVTSAEPIAAPIGVVALTEATGFYLSSTGLAAPDDVGEYPPGNDIHDLFVASTDSLDAWSNLLATDNGISAALLPLGDAGGAVIVVRDTATGDPVAGATASSQNAGSVALIRYPSADASTLGTETDDSGIIIVLDPALAEVFAVDTGNESVLLTVGSSDGAVFTAQAAAG